ncbi:ribosomal protein S18-alanine N-acetyltransferase [Alteromonas oceanisediminis]|uniref:ribosomal protein S18-alanine N-acetyltransferase n=1 Tax=Alteromonas oceanisediminis TaxID=2836180 RepID=UPI001BDAF3F9|nr:ribosomal protein S18-alanine N-acetyltransferase [Alteromonas oceanisediminis]MBT0584843.1 ribosomal protein S18-alanine N-acetyltransferase [Alteromonas oceanisediminis]
MLITPLTHEDAEQAYALCRISHPVPWSFRVFADCLSAPYFAAQARDDGTCLGYYIGLSVLDEVTLMDIVVCPTQRGRGLGKTLLDHFLTYARGLHATKAWLEVRASNSTAISLYRYAGFEHIEVRTGYYENPRQNGQSSEKEDALVLAKVLSKEAPVL